MVIYQNLVTNMKVVDNSELVITHEKCPNIDFFWSVFSCIRISTYSVQMRENTDQKKNPYLDAFHGVYWRTECIEVVAISYFVNDNIFERKVIYFLEKLSCNINPIHVIARHRITKKNDRVIVKLSQRNF